jgi:2,6-dihydroxypseudooxynicotine hydrolase
MHVLFDLGRMLADGLPYSDVTTAQAEINDASAWLPFWTERAATYERLGTEAMHQGNDLTAGEFLWLASLCCHYAQFMWFHDRETRSRIQNEKVRLYDAAAPHLNPPAARLDIAFADYEVPHSIPGFLRVPTGTPPAQGWPVVLIVGGTESTKEEAHRFEDLCLARGLATYAFDGPGQGEMLDVLPTQPHFERWSRRVVDELQRQPGLDSTRVGVIGRSLGAHYALRIAACDERIAVCVAWGPFFDMSDALEVGPQSFTGDLYNAGFDGDVENGLPVVQSMLDLADVAAGLRVPTYILHGAKDAIVSQYQAEALRHGFPNADVTFVVDPNGTHCCHNLAHLHRPALADFAAGVLCA